MSGAPTMSILAKLKFDPDLDSYVCRHKLGMANVDVVADLSEASVELSDLAAVIQSVSKDWAKRHKRLAQLAAEELLANDYVETATEIKAADCKPFYLRVYADPDGEISYTIAFNIDSVLDADEEYVDIEEEIGGDWVNTEICCTE